VANENVRPSISKVTSRSKALVTGIRVGAALRSG
jgi:hypothetical protein